MSGFVLEWQSEAVRDHVPAHYILSLLINKTAGGKRKSCSRKSAQLPSSFTSATRVKNLFKRLALFVILCKYFSWFYPELFALPSPLHALRGPLFGWVSVVSRSGFVRHGSRCDVRPVDCGKDWIFFFHLKQSTMPLQVKSFLMRLLKSAPQFKLQTVISGAKSTRFHIKTAYRFARHNTTGFFFSSFFFKKGCMLMCNIWMDCYDTRHCFICLCCTIKYILRI